MVNFEAIAKNQYRILINRTFEFKTVQLTGLPFRIQEIAKKLTKNREIEQKHKNLPKKNQFSSKKVRKLSETQLTRKSCENFHNLRPTKKKFIEFP